MIYKLAFLPILAPSLMVISSFFRLEQQMAVMLATFYLSMDLDYS